MALSKAEQLADEIGDRIESGELSPGSRLPSMAELARETGHSGTTIQAAYQILRGIGLVESFHGRGTFVRVAKPTITRDAHERYNWEKRRAAGGDDAELSTLVLSADLAASPGVDSASDEDIRITASYSLARVSETDPDTQELLGVGPNAKILIRQFKTFLGGKLLVETDSVMPAEPLEENPDLLDEAKEPWPGGTMAQLATVGIEIDRIIDEVSARSASLGEVRAFDLADGIPVFEIFKTSIDTDGRVVEVATSVMPADSTTLRYTTQLDRW